MGGGELSRGVVARRAKVAPGSAPAAESQAEEGQTGKREEGAGLRDTGQVGRGDRFDHVQREIAVVVVGQQEG